MTLLKPVRRVDKIAFGKPTHYYVDGAGRKVPGVTTLLSNGFPKPALVNWAGNVTAAYAVDNWDELADLKPSERLAVLKKARYEDRDAAAKRGTEVHDYAERLVHGIAVDVPDELRGHVESYARFLDDWEPKPIYVERSLVSYEYGYAGTLDLIYELANGERILADIKTTRSGIYGETALQLAAYRYADAFLPIDEIGQDEPIPPVDSCQAIWVRADGYSVIPLQADEAVFQDFRRVAQVARVAERIPTYVCEERIRDE